MNCTVIEYGGSMILVDAGLKIPQGNMPGVDLILPDLSYVLDNAHRLEGVFLTHGHEDHIGALPYLLGRIQKPVYGTAFTLALVRERLADPDRDAEPFDGPMVQLLFTEAVTCGPFTVEAVRVSHSIPDGAALIIDTPAGTVVHSGDFKYDPQPLDGHRIDEDRLSRAGDGGVLCLLCDSTNADRPGITASESEVSRTLKELIGGAEGRVFVTTFASHIHRIQSVVDAASHSGRTVVMEGRRMIANCELAARLGYLRSPPGVPVSSGTPAEGGDRIVFLVTGSQGEPMSALSRIARDEHPDIKIKKGDTVIFSSRVIPGNELTTAFIIDQLFRRGARVHYQSPPTIHTSGHGNAQEIDRMIRSVRPRYFVPVHGDFRQLTACARLALAAGVPTGNEFIMDPGDVLEVSAEGAGLVDSVPAGMMMVDGDMMTAFEDPILRDRRQISRAGVVFVAVSVPSPIGGPAVSPDVHSVGVAQGEAARQLDEQAARSVSELLDHGRSAVPPVEALKEEIRLTVRSLYRKTTGKRPWVVVAMLEKRE
jgi:ribonuclease J